MNTTEPEETSASPQAIWLCRHGNRIDFVDPNWTGSEPHLSDDGIVQARETAECLRAEPIRHIISSPFLRAVETAYHIAEALDLKIKIEHGVCEWLNPEWSDTPPSFIPLRELQERFPRIDLDYKPLIQPTYPETREEMNVRCAQTLSKIFETFTSDLLIIGHGASVVGLAQALLGPSEGVRTGMCSLTKIIREKGKTHLEINGDTSHLKDGEIFRDKLI